MVGTITEIMCDSCQEAHGTLNSDSGIEGSDLPLCRLLNLCDNVFKVLDRLTPQGQQQNGVSVKQRDDVASHCVEIDARFFVQEGLSEEL